MIVPTDAGAGFTEDKGKTLGAFANYFLCEGQQQAECSATRRCRSTWCRPGSSRCARSPAATRKNVNISKCNNPTFSADGTNKLANTAPYPPACDKQGADPVHDRHRRRVAYLHERVIRFGRLGRVGVELRIRSGGTGATGDGGGTTTGDGAGAVGLDSSKPLTVAGSPMTIPASSTSEFPGVIIASAVGAGVLIAILAPPMLSAYRDHASERRSRRSRRRGRVRSARAPNVHPTVARTESNPSSARVQGQ